MASNGRRDEEMPLLLQHNGDTRTRKSQSLLSRCHRHLMADVSRDWADVVLIFCYFITGLLDSASISVWGSFVSMQTGNTVYIGLGLSSPSTSTRWIKSGTSVLAFCIGSFLFSRFHRFFSPTRRWVLAASFTSQVLLTAAAAGMVTAAGTPPPSHGGGGNGKEGGENDIGWRVLVPIALVAFQSCGQAVVSRALRYNALTSVVLTSIYCDLFSDAELFALRNVDRNRRVGAPVCLVLGALLGGWFAHGALGVAGALWTAAGLKAVVVGVWLVWPKAREVEGR